MAHRGIFVAAILSIKCALRDSSRSLEEYPRRFDVKIGLNGSAQVSWVVDWQAKANVGSSEVPGESTTSMNVLVETVESEHLNQQTLHDLSVLDIPTLQHAYELDELIPLGMARLHQLNQVLGVRTDPALRQFLRYEKQSAG
jgi:hypothetical protein